MQIRRGPTRLVYHDAIDQVHPSALDVRDNPDSDFLGVDVSIFCDVKHSYPFFSFRDFVECRS
jgi:hypothetical protein